MTRNKLIKRQNAASDGGPQKLGYFIARALINFKQNMSVTLLTVGTITLALLIISLFLLVYVNLEGLAETWSEKVQVTTYFEQELSPTTVSALKQNVMALRGTERTVYVAKDEAFRRFQNRLKGQESLLEGITPEVMPASLEITLKRDNRSSTAVEAYVAELRKLPGITEVQYGEEWVKRFNTFMTFVRLVGALLGGFLIVSVIFIVSNTIKLTIYARRDELEVLGLVGATRFFIKAPFLIEGILQGAIGALLAILFLTTCYFVFLHNAGNFLTFNSATAGLVFLPPIYLAGIVLGGIALGFLGSSTSLRRFII